MPGQEPRILAALNWGIATLREAGIGMARLDAEVLLAHALGRERLDLYVRPDATMARADRERYQEMVHRRAARVPVAYLTGRREFMSLEFRVDARVLIPRPETERLVEEATYLLRGLRGRSRAPAVDLGTGSGAIAVSCAVRTRDVSFVAIDRSESALDVARANALRHGVIDRIDFLQGRLLEPLEGLDLRGRIPLILCNPPYVSPGVYEVLAPEIHQEPRDALVPQGGDPTALRREILEQASKFLRPRGVLLLEVGEGQAHEALEDARRCGFRDARALRDLQGIPRVILAERP